MNKKTEGRTNLKVIKRLNNLDSRNASNLVGLAKSKSNSIKAKMQKIIHDVTHLKSFEFVILKFLIMTCLIYIS